MLTSIIFTRSRSLSARLQPKAEHARPRLTTPLELPPLVVVGLPLAADPRLSMVPPFKPSGTVGPSHATRRVCSRPTLCSQILCYPKVQNLSVSGNENCGVSRATWSGWCCERERSARPKEISDEVEEGLPEYGSRF